MRLGGPIFQTPSDPDHWIAQLRAEQYAAAYCPLKPDTDDATVLAYATAAAKANIVIAEVGAFGVNPIHDDMTVRKQAIDYCSQRLALAERVGARCCVNITGSRNTQRWAAPHPDNFTRETFDLIVQSTREIIDAVRPKRSHYSLEMMPWIWPATADQYLQLIAAIDRPALGVHFDPVNIITSPLLAYDTPALLRECFAKLAPHIRSCHAKDITLIDKLTMHLDECGPGEGLLDYATFLRELSRLDPDMPLMLEHLKTPEQYRAGAAHIRKIAQQENLSWR